MINLCLPRAVFLLAAIVSHATATTIGQFSVPVIQNFDTLANAGTTNTTIPEGWSFAETGSGANATYAAGTGSSATGNTYSFGEASSTERAFGTLRTSSILSAIGTVVTNETGATITSLIVAYTGEQWRLGAIGRVDRLDFSYSLDATSLTTGSWLDFDALDFVAPISAGTLGLLDGNAAANQSAVSSTLSGLNLAAGSTVWLRWTDFVATGSNDGLGIDDVTISALGVVIPNPEPPTASVPEGLPTSFLAIVLLGVLRAGAARRMRAVPVG